MVRRKVSTTGRLPGMTAAGAGVVPSTRTKAFLSKQRDREAALIFLKESLKRLGWQETNVTDRLNSYRSALHELGSLALQIKSRPLNNRIASRVLRAA